MKVDMRVVEISERGDVHEKWEVVNRKIERVRERERESERESYRYAERNEGGNRQWEKETHTDCVFVNVR